MRRKCFIMAGVSFATALAIFVFAYFLYHYLGPDGSFGTVFRSEPAKPLVTLYVGIWGVIHYAAALISLTAGFVFFSKEP